MFITSLAAMTAAGLLSAELKSTKLDVAPSYGKALAAAAEQHKPVAVFIGSGAAAHLTGDDDAMKALKTSYVTVRVDTATADGKKLAESFGITDGIVISDRTGGVQALRHEGKIESTDLTNMLVKFADQPAATTTEVSGTAAPVAAEPVYQPSPYTGGFTQPALGGYMPFGRSSCPNCR